MSISISKICKGCNLEKAADQFSIQTVKRPYGIYEYLYPYCKSCACKKSSANWKKKPKLPRKHALLSEHSKVCRKCKIEKPTKDFGTVKPGRGDSFNRPSWCKSCRLEKNVRWHEKNSTRSKENRTRWGKENADHVRDYNKRVRVEDPAKHALNFKQWSQRNSAHRTAKQNVRRASKLKATPAWLSSVDIARMEEFHEIAVAKTMQIGICHEVDHVVPLQGKTVCGLHVPWNLQVLTESENSSKRNKLLEGV